MRNSVIQSSLLTAILVAETMFIGCTSSVTRADRKLEDLLAARQADDVAQAQQGRQLMQKLLERVEAKVDASTKDANVSKPTIDLLIISGGGDWGAFGAGVLKGWGRVKGELARPQFDAVSGVSTGATMNPSSASSKCTAIPKRIGQLRAGCFSSGRAIRHSTPYRVLSAKCARRWTAQ